LGKEIARCWSSAGKGRREIWKKGPVRRACRKCIYFRRRIGLEMEGWEAYTLQARERWKER
jgi:hypothetical protein